MPSLVFRGCFGAPLSTRLCLITPDGIDGPGIVGFATVTIDQAQALGAGTADLNDPLRLGRGLQPALHVLPSRLSISPRDFITSCEQRHWRLDITVIGDPQDTSLLGHLPTSFVRQLHEQNADIDFAQGFEPDLAQIRESLDQLKIQIICNDAQDLVARADPFEVILDEECLKNGENPHP
jgi:hypothetical protein